MTNIKSISDDHLQRIKKYQYCIEAPMRYPLTALELLLLPYKEWPRELLKTNQDSKNIKSLKKEFKFQFKSGLLGLLNDTSKDALGILRVLKPYTDEIIQCFKGAFVGLKRQFSLVSNDQPGYSWNNFYSNQTHALMHIQEDIGKEDIKLGIERFYRMLFVNGDCYVPSEDRDVSTVQYVKSFNDFLSKKFDGQDKWVQFFSRLLHSKGFIYTLATSIKNALYLSEERSFDQMIKMNTQKKASFITCQKNKNESSLRVHYTMLLVENVYMMMDIKVEYTEENFHICHVRYALEGSVNEHLGLLRPLLPDHSAALTAIQQPLRWESISQTLAPQFAKIYIRSKTADRAGESYFNPAFELPKFQKGLLPSLLKVLSFGDNSVNQRIASSKYFKDYFKRYFKQYDDAEKALIYSRLCQYKKTKRLVGKRRLLGFIADKQLPQASKVSLVRHAIIQRNIKIVLIEDLIQCASKLLELDVKAEYTENLLGRLSTCLRRPLRKLLSLQKKKAKIETKLAQDLEKAKLNFTNEDSRKRGSSSVSLSELSPKDKANMVLQKKITALNASFCNPQQAILETITALCKQYKKATTQSKQKKKSAIAWRAIKKNLAKALRAMVRPRGWFNKTCLLDLLAPEQLAKLCATCAGNPIFEALKQGKTYCHIAVSEKRYITITMSPKTLRRFDQGERLNAAVDDFLFEGGSSNSDILTNLPERSSRTLSNSSLEQVDQTVRNQRVVVIPECDTQQPVSRENVSASINQQNGMSLTSN